MQSEENCHSGQTEHRLSSEGLTSSKATVRPEGSCNFGTNTVFSQAELTLRDCYCCFLVGQSYIGAPLSAVNSLTGATYLHVTIIY